MSQIDPLAGIEPEESLEFDPLPSFPPLDNRSAPVGHPSGFGANGKDEMNLAEFPIARLGRNDTRLTIEYKGQITDKQGVVVEQRWLVSGSATFGLPTEFADRVLVALMVITARASFSDRKVPFTIYRILKLLGLSHNQRNYAAVEKALQQLVGVTIYSEGAFWDHALQRRVTTKKGFHILEEFWLKSFEEHFENSADPAGSENEAESFQVGTDQGGSINGYVVWGERIWESFQSGYIKHLDVNFYYALENTLARRLFRFLDKRMHYQDSYQIDIFDLAARLGMKPYPFASHLARKLKPAFDELQTRGFLARTDVVKVGEYTRIRFVRAGLSNYFSTVVPIGSENHVEGPRSDDILRLGQTLPKMKIEGSAGLYERFSTPLRLQQIWAAVLHEYTQTLPPATYGMLAESAWIELTGGKAVLAVDGRYRGWVERQLHRQLRTTLNHHLSADEQVNELQFIEF